MNPTWKKRALQTSMLALLTTVAIGAVSASAAETSTSKPAKTFNMVTAAPAVHIASIFGGLLNNPAVERNYLKLLVSTYSPDTLADWQKALEDRKQAEAEMPKPTFSKRVTLKNGEETKFDGAAPAGTVFFSAVGSAEPMEGLPPFTDLEELPELPQLMPGKAAEGTTRSKRIIINREAPTDGEVQKPITRVLPVEPGTAGDIIVGEPVQPESIKLQQKLVEAIEADNADSIRVALADYLKEYVKQSEQMSEFAKKIKDKLPTETESK